jgi:3-dehydroquinate dehydratase I
MQDQVMLAGVVNPEILERMEADSLDSAYLAAAKCAVLEIRYDLFVDRALWAELAARLQGQFPSAILIGTIRLVCDGGRYANNALEKRAQDWKRIITDATPPQWIDVELSDLKANAGVIALAAEHGIKVIGSRHDFQGVPSLDQLRKDMVLAQEAGLQGFKIAAMSKVGGDCEPLYQIAHEAKGSFEIVSAFAMGATGSVSRLYSLAAGANLSYASLGASVAPGQLSVEKMLEVLPKLPNAKSESDLSRLLT